MKKSKKWIVWTIMIVFVVGCLIIFVPNKKEVVHDDFDFWKETYDILAKKIGGLNLRTPLGRSSCRIERMQWRRNILVF